MGHNLQYLRLPGGLHSLIYVLLTIMALNSRNDLIIAWSLYIHLRSICLMQCILNYLYGFVTTFSMHVE